jgi:hypothetical protein
MTCTQTVHNVGSDRLTRRFEVSVRENRHLSRVRHRTQRYVQSRPDHSVVGALSKDARPASLSTLVQSFQAVRERYLYSAVLHLVCCLGTRSDATI